MSDSSIEQMLRESFPPGLPYGFAEMVANAAMMERGSTFWDLLLSLTPRAGLAIGAVAVLLLILGFAGDGPGLIDAVDQYEAFSSLIPLP